MATYTACVEWKLAPGQDFLGRRYGRGHCWTFDGGASIPASSSPDVVPLPWSDAAAVDPEEALVASASACHMLWFLSLAAERGVSVAGYRDEASGVLAKDDRGAISMTRITLRPRIDFGPGPTPDREDLEALHHEAHDRCFIANSLRTEIEILLD